MKARLNVLLLLAIAAALLTAGCAGSGRPDNGSAPTATAIANASRDLYAGEFDQGFAHHASASGFFNNATALWNDDDYAAAASLLKDARVEYAVAESHYGRMAGYAADDGERAFAGALEESAMDMDAATSRYLMSIDAAMADNDTASLEYFEEGQDLVDRSMAALNQSFDLMPSYLSEAN
ncbi:MAG TPA: hypothetical protein VMC61_05480 [Methanocella sp.]|nr:hypothetical protein [Methanocella sp.]